MSPNDIRVLADLLEAFATHDEAHCGGTEHRIESANVMRACANLYAEALIFVESAHRFERLNSTRINKAIANLEALKP